MVNKANKTIRARKEKLRMGIIFALALAFILTSCQQKTFDTKEELITYLADEENGYTQEKSVNGVDFTIAYRPNDLLVSQEVFENMSNAQIDSLRNKYKEYMYFNVSLSQNNQEILSNVASKGNDFGGMVNQLAFGMGDKVHLFSKTKDTLEMGDYAYPRLYGMSDKTTMLFVYPRNEELLKHEFFHFSIEDLGLNTGEVSFKILTEPILQEPILKF